MCACCAALCQPKRSVSNSVVIRWFCIGFSSLHSIVGSALAHSDVARCIYAYLCVYVCRLLHSNRTARTAGEKPAQREPASNRKRAVGVRQWRPDQNSLPGPGYRRRLPLQKRGLSEAALAVGPLRVTSIVVKPLAHGELYRRYGMFQQAGCEVPCMRSIKGEASSTATSVQ